MRSNITPNNQLGWFTAEPCYFSRQQRCHSSPELACALPPCSSEPVQLHFWPPHMYSWKLCSSSMYRNGTSAAAAPSSKHMTWLGKQTHCVHLHISTGVVWLHSYLTAEGTAGSMERYRRPRGAEWLGGIHNKLSDSRRPPRAGHLTRTRQSLLTLWVIFYPDSHIPRIPWGQIQQLGGWVY